MTSDEPRCVWRIGCRLWQLVASWALGVALLGSSAVADGGELSFRHHFVDNALPSDGWGQTALADLDGDGDLDFVTGRSRGEIRWYEYRGAADWRAHPITDRSPSDVGAVVLDVNADGRPDVVAGGAWYQNPGDRGATAWKAFVFDDGLNAVHDVKAGDVDGDGRADVVTMSDRNDVRWYRVSDDPTRPWQATRIGDPIHAGIALGDLDGDGDLDVVRGTAWFENQDKGARWVPRRLHDMAWSVDRSFPGAAKAVVADIDGDGKQDVVLTEAEKNGARVAWFEAPQDPRTDSWTAHVLRHSDPAPRGPYHSLAVADFDGDGDLDIFAGEMEHLGQPPHRWFIWTQEAPGKGEFAEHVILDAGLGTHEAVAADVDQDGDVDIVGKLWRPVRENANEGKNHADFLENLLRSPSP